ncbi:hypothetical protein [Mycobacterium sp. 852002-51057_SCH5723018]|uniref:hypothetical protein n=1 Tax=Mycobacterium sp. 852002-51057_SCH5723018 TaxID=1834094 RepID=UPI0007FCF965|nr:hypothetical protein [Mycobacterium sp. 852002-51057_SCH5723018]OBG18792.1 hypothetical protein A5764_18570 [Mycobacterium sp. 852002-51057_SCH5723018]
MKLNKLAATAAMAGALGSAALGIGAGFAQADPNGPNVPGPGPNVPGPNVPGPDQQPGPGYVPGQPICNPGPGANCNGPGSPLPPGQHGAPPPGHYNEPARYGLPPTWHNPQGYPDGDYPVVFNPAVNQWGVFINGQFVAYAG